MGDGADGGDGVMEVMEVTGVKGMGGLQGQQGTLFQKCPFWKKYISNIFNDYYGNLLSAGQMGAERSVVDFVSLKTANMIT